MTREEKKLLKEKRRAIIKELLEMPVNTPEERKSFHSKQDEYNNTFIK